MGAAQRDPASRSLGHWATEVLVLSDSEEVTACHACSCWPVPELGTTQGLMNTSRGHTWEQTQEHRSAGCVPQTGGVGVRDKVSQGWRDMRIKGSASYVTDLSSIAGTAWGAPSPISDPEHKTPPQLSTQTPPPAEFLLIPQSQFINAVNFQAS